MRIAIGNVQRGHRAKVEIASLLKSLGHEMLDFGCDENSQVDYPDIARPVAEAVAGRKCELGILIGVNGIGMCMAANKVHGIRAAVAYDEFSACFTRERHHCNVLCLGIDLHGDSRLDRIVKGFLSTPVAGGRFARMVDKIMQIEAEQNNADGQGPDLE